MRGRFAALTSTASEKHPYGGPSPVYSILGEGLVEYLLFALFVLALLFVVQ